MAKPCHRASFEMETAPQHSLEYPMSPLLESKPSTPSEGMLSQKEARTLEESSSSLLRHLFPHFAILVIPTYSIILGASIAMLDGKAQSRAGDVIMQAARVAATLWPITFAAVVGPMVKAIAMYRVEKGTRLGTLETLSASQTLMSTIRGCLALGEFNILVLLILTIWLPSPVGSQAVLRSLELHQTLIESDTGIQSFPVNMVVDIPADLDDFGGAESYYQWRTMATAALSGWDIGLMHSNGSSHTFSGPLYMAGGDRLAIDSTRGDLWRNVRIPFLHMLPEYDKRRPFEWVNVPSDRIPPYESLIGIPIRGIPPRVAGNMSIVIQSYYQRLTVSAAIINTDKMSIQTNRQHKCGPWRSGTELLLNPPIDLLLNPIVNGTIQLTSDTNATGSSTYLDIVKDTERLAQIRNNPQTGSFSKQVLVFGSRVRSSNNTVLCDITTSYVDSKIECIRTADDTQLSCAAIAVRHTENPPLSENITAFDAYNKSSMLRIIPSVMASGPDERGIFEKFLENPSLAFIRNEKYPYTDWRYFPSEVFEARLGMLINTFIRASYDIETLVGMRMNALNDNPLWANVTGTWRQFTEDVYDLQTPWFTLYVFSTVVLTLCALGNILLRSMTRVPDFLGSVSSLTRDSPFIDAPTSGSTMNGMERARLLKDKWVRIQDVKPNEEVGRLAFSDAKGSGGLRIHRKYE